ncbi:MAG: FAD:protein FMN transferase [Bacilli bacterium]|nr:FAD:protein FMN transferase [Bacilli bacterium]
MVKKIIDKRNYIIFGIILILFLLIISGYGKTKEYIKTFEYFNETITIKLYSNKNVDKIWKGIDIICSRYQNYYDNSYSNVDKGLTNYGITLYEKTNDLIDVNSDVKFDSVIGPYVAVKIKKYLEKNGIDSYIINEEGNIITGSHYNKSKYKISITDVDGKLVDIVNLKNMNMAIKGNVSEYKPYMFNSISGEKVLNNKLVVVVDKDLNRANYIANVVYLLDFDKREDFVKNLNACALWQDENGKIVMTESFKKYL